MPRQIAIEPLVSGVSQQGTQMCPFPLPALAIGAAVILSWPSSDEGRILEAASAASGPWTPTNEVPTQQGGQNVVAVYTDANHRFFRRSTRECQSTRFLKARRSPL